MRPARALTAGLYAARARSPARRYGVSAARAVSAIELIHRALDVLERDLRGRGRATEHLLGDRLLVVVERRQHVLREIRPLAQLRGGDADADAREALTHLAHDRAHPVVRARTAGPADAHRAERQVDLVEDHEHVLRVEAIAVEELLHGAAAVVHEGLRPRDRDLHPADRPFGDARLGGLDPELRAGALPQPVRDRAADV